MDRGILMLLMVALADGGSFNVYAQAARQSPGQLRVEAAAIDAFKDDWVPPAPVRSRELREVRRAKGGAESKARGRAEIKLELPATPELEELRDARVFAHPLRHTKGEAPGASERAKCAAALKQYVARGGQMEVSNAEILKKFLGDHAGSGFALSMQIELGELYLRHGYFLRSKQAYLEAWEGGKDLADQESARQSEIALVQLLRIMSRLGMKDELRELLESVEEREVGGFAKEAIIHAKNQYWYMTMQPEENIFCGFTAANKICTKAGFPAFYPDVHDEEEERIFIADGLSLYELKAHSHESGGTLKVVKRGQGAPVVVPSIVHWSFGHYSAVSESREGKYRVTDEHIKFDSWVDTALFDEQGSGYFLVMEDTQLPAGYTEVGDEEAKGVYGRHCTHGVDDEGDDCPKCKGGEGPMAVYGLSMFKPGVVIQDTPIRYRPPFGPAVSFQLNYYQRSAVVQDLSAHGNFGPRWSHSNHSYVDLKGTGAPNTSIDVIWGNGTYYNYSYDSGSGSYGTKYGNRPQLDYLDGTGPEGSPGYQLTHPDGSQWWYLQENSPTPTRYYLTHRIDPFGNTVELGYDSSTRLKTVTDALGQETTISYSGSDTKITKITDPFSRDATFTYTASGQLKKITDPVGIVSEFKYEATGDIIEELITPYGSTKFTFGELPGWNNWPSRPKGLWIEAEDPYGERERMEQNENVFAFDTSQTYDFVDTYEIRAPSSVDVDGSSVSFLPKNDLIQFRNSYHWDKEQMRHHEGDPLKATIYNWLAINNTITSELASMKRPEQAREWYNYQGQTNNHAPGTFQSPSKIVQAVETASGMEWRMTQNEYDEVHGNLERTIDPMGREVEYDYAANGIDLTAVKVKDGGTLKTVFSASSYLNHKPQSITDAAGTTRSITYNDVGQVEEITISKGSESETTQFTYDLDLDGTPDDEGYLIKLEKTDPDNAAAFVTVSEFEYDSAGRVSLSRNAEDYEIEYDYDDIDRVTLVTYPDATTAQNDYGDYLEAQATKDRNGNWSRFRYNANRKLVFQQDAKGRLTAYEWCRCGDIRKITDAKGQVTEWVRDNGGRVTDKIYPDGKKFSYTYQTLSGLVDSVTYPKDQGSNPTISYTYYLDGKLEERDYTDAGTADVSYTYEDTQGRLSGYTDGIGTSALSYVSYGSSSSGAGKLYEINGPWANDTARYSYDYLGRQDTREIRDDASNVLSTRTRDYDSLGRVIEVDNNLGTFTYNYDGTNHTRKIDSIDLPNGLETVFDYHPLVDDANDGRLKEIHHKITSSGTTISRFEYEYDPAGRIKEWTRQLGSNASADTTVFELGYSRADELIEAVLKNDTQTTVLEKYAYEYDAAGNRQQKSVDDSSTYTQHNGRNQLTQEGGAGTTMVEGTVDEPSSVTVNGDAAVVTSLPGSGDFLFRKEIALTQGSNTITIVATDADSEQTTQEYTVDVGSIETTLEYDDNGNLIKEIEPGGATKVFEWDAENRLTAVQSDETPVSGSTRSEFSYDGMSRRVRIVEKSHNGSVWSEVSNKTYLWCGTQLCQERNSAGSTVTKNYFKEGVEEGSDDYYYHRDHLGSIRELTDSTGAVKARYDYTPYGVRTKLEGSLDTDFGFTGHYYHEGSALHLALYRAYDASQGRWLSADPIGEVLSANLYGYVLGDPVGSIDPYGLCEVPSKNPHIGGITLTINNDSTPGNIPNAGTHTWLTVETRYTNGTVGTVDYGHYSQFSGGAQRNDGVNYGPEGSGGGSGQSYTPTESRTSEISGAAIDALMDAIHRAMSKRWRKGYNCSDFAAEVWRAATGERLDPAHGGSRGDYPAPGIGTPTRTGDAIIDANGGVAHGTMSP